MQQSLAKIAAVLNFDAVVNSLMERLYWNGRAQGRFTRRYQILTYHKISTDPHPFFPPTHPEVFEAQMHFLKHHYNVLPLLELVERCRRGDVPAGAVAITFDDGYRDNYELAFPILRKYELPATVFVATGVIGNAQILWHDRVFDAFRFASVGSDSEDSRNGALDRALRKARSLHGDERLRFVEEVEESLAPAIPSSYAGPRMLDWDQVREMHRNGIEFGSHTVTHPILSRIPREAVEWELRQSARRLSEELGVPIRSFAYPNGRSGDYSEEVKKVLQDCGYVCAVTTERGVNRFYTDPFELKRGQPWQTDIDVFRLRFFLERHSLAS